MDTPIINATELLKTHCKHKRIYKAELARKMNVEYKVVIRALKSNNIDINKLVAFCHGLEHNFLMEMALQLPVTYTYNTTNNHQQEITALQAQILKLETEKNLLQQLLATK